jgi:hypothetical protein
MAQQFAIFGVAVVFITVGLTNKKRGKGPWMSFLVGGVAMLILEGLNLFGIVKM